MTLKRAVLKTALLTGLATLARRASARQLRILCYHGLWVTPGFEFGDCLFIAPEQFERRMERLKRSGRPVLPLGEAVERLAANDLPEAAVVITIDDGWVSTLTHALPVLEALGLPATLYATTWYSGRELPVVNVAVQYLVAASGRRDIDPDWVSERIEALPLAERLPALRVFGAGLRIDEAWLETRQFHIMSPGELAEAERRGLDVQLHTHRHIDLAAQIDSLPLEIEENRACLRRAIGAKEFVHFCNPSGSTHPRVRVLLARAGIASATLVDEGLNAPGADPLALRRFLDGRRVGDIEFDAYLSGTLHFVSALRAGPKRGRRAAAMRSTKAVSARC
jgi:peptidoglycan/xylan/chitin deacetylase (PgdA/CDA1 family)